MMNKTFTFTEVGQNARALLPAEVGEGSKLKYELLQYQLISERA